MIREYARDRTCMVISHDMDFIAGVSDRILVLNGGKSSSRAATRNCWRAAACTGNCTRPRTSIRRWCGARRPAHPATSTADRDAGCLAPSPCLRTGAGETRDAHATDPPCGGPVGARFMARRHAGILARRHAPGRGGEVTRSAAGPVLALREATDPLAVLARHAPGSRRRSRWPWLPRPPAGDWIAKYAPVRDGDARLSARGRRRRQRPGWIAQNSRLIPGLRVYTDVRKAIADGFLAAARRPARKPSLTASSRSRVGRLTIIEIRTYDLGLDGEVAEAWQYAGARPARRPARWASTIRRTTAT